MKASSAGFTPPSPCTASTRTAAVVAVIADATEPRSLKSASTKPFGNGSKPICTLVWPVAVSVASVLP